MDTGMEEQAQHTAVSSPPSLHEGAVMSGFVWGLLLGYLTMLFRGPRFPWHSVQQLSTQVLERIESDPVQEALDAGKAEVRRRSPADA